MTFITNLPHFYFMQSIFRYAGPILIACETIAKTTNDRNRKWILVLETTRILLAHGTIFDLANDQIRDTLANNVRNLYRLFGIDMSTKQHWENVSNNNSYYTVRAEDGKIWVPQDRVLAITEFETVSFDDMKDEFDNETNEVKRILGHSIYVLVATSDNLWKQEMNQYK